MKEKSGFPIEDFGNESYLWIPAFAGMIKRIKLRMTKEDIKKKEEWILDQVKDDKSILSFCPAPFVFPKCYCRRYIFIRNIYSHN
ncbi:MAG: hypothetical protein PHQ76_04005 [Caldisericia bacterium]|nr:hypothetical protein [Caldisericia bacterium]